MVNRLVLLFYSTESAYVTGQIHPFIQAQKCFLSNIDTLNASGVTQGREHFGLQTAATVMFF